MHVHLLTLTQASVVQIRAHLRRVTELHAAAQHDAAQDEAELQAFLDDHSFSSVGEAGWEDTELDVRRVVL
jgi:hypothetical protein